MRMENGAHSPKKKGFIQNTFIISGDDSPQKKTGKIIAIIALLLIIAALIFGGMLIARSINTQKGIDDNNDLHNSSTPVSETSKDPTSSTGDGDETFAPPVDEFDADGILVELSDLYKLNQDVLGWVKIPNTPLDYVVAKRSVEDDPNNDYYLARTLKHKHDPYGTPYADHRGTYNNGFQSTNATIYGHNSKEGKFFEAVKSYKDINFYKEHPTMTFNTIYGSGQYKILGVFTEFVDAEKAAKDGIVWFNYHDYVDFSPNPNDSAENAKAEKIYNSFVSKFNERSYYDSGVDVQFGDHFLTLSTCNDDIQGPTNTPYRDVLIARKVRPGEDPNFDVSQIKENTDMIMPAGWIKKYGKDNPYK